jgi:hypothetical protein
MTDAHVGSDHETTIDSAGGNRDRALPRRDWILLPAIGLLTVGFILVSTELIARRMFTESKNTIASCLVLNDPSTGVRGIPNSVCREKALETEWIESRFNSCGHRAGVECRPKQPGMYRIVMTGSSLAMGANVQREETFAALLPQELSQRTGRRIELYNEGTYFGYAHNTALRFNDVLTAQPDLILWILTPIDVSSAQFVLPASQYARWNDQSFMTKVTRRIQSSIGAGSISDAFSKVFDRTRTAFLLKHYLYQSQSQYVRSFLVGSDGGTDPIKTEATLAWKAQLHAFENEAADIEQRARDGGVPIVVMLVPNRAQAAMISMGEWPEGYDPYKLDHDLRDITQRHGGTYIDIFPGFRNIPNPERFYYPVDGHPNAQGHAIIADLMAKGLTSGAVPTLSVDTQQQIAQKRGK